MCTGGAVTKTNGEPRKLGGLINNNPLKARGGKDSFTPISDVEAANVSDLYRKNYDKEAAMSRMRTMGASADPKLVQRMLANARAVDEKHYKAMLKAYNDANNPPDLRGYHPARAMIEVLKMRQAGTPISKLLIFGNKKPSRMGTL